MATCDVPSISSVLIFFHILLPFIGKTHFTSGVIIPSCTTGVATVSYQLYKNDTKDATIVFPNSTDIPVRPGYPTVFLIHGFLGFTEDSYLQTFIDLAKNWTNMDGSNVFIVDWQQAACDDGLVPIRLLGYPFAAINTKVVGEYVARFIVLLTRNFGVRLEDVKLVGHSLGAQVAGFTGKEVQNTTNGKVSTIWGLDAAGGPGFDTQDPANRLDEADAVVVQCHHTSILSSRQHFCTIDFHMNGGLQQPACPLLTNPGCSHNIAMTYVLEMIVNPNCPFVGKRWRVGDVPPTGPCTPDDCVSAGLLAQGSQATGVFYVYVNNAAPFCGAYPS